MMAIAQIRTLVLAAVLAIGVVGGSQSRADGVAEPMVVYKDANCGCCVKWMEHLRAHGLAVRGVDLDAVALAERKRELGIPPRMQSCHTAVTADGLVFEGHVPATSMARFLAARPAGGQGLAVPGMPPGSPGMEMGDRFVPYTLWQLNADGEATAFEQVGDRRLQYAPDQLP